MIPPSGHISVIEHFLAVPSCDVDGVDNENNTALHYAARQVWKRDKGHIRRTYAAHTLHIHRTYTIHTHICHTYTHTLHIRSTYTAHTPYIHHTYTHMPHIHTYTAHTQHIHCTFAHTLHIHCTYAAHTHIARSQFINHLTGQGQQKWGFWLNCKYSTTLVAGPN